MQSDSKIQMIDHHLKVPDFPVIPFIASDRIGNDIMGSSQMEIDAAVFKSYGDSRKLIWHEVLAVAKAYLKSGEWLATATLKDFKEYLVGIKAPLASPDGGGILSSNVALMQFPGLFVCLRPVSWYKGVPSPVRYLHLIDMHMFRENT